MHPSKVPYTLQTQIARYLDGDLGVYRLLSGEMLCNSDVTVVCYVSFSGREFDIID